MNTPLLSRTWKVCARGSDHLILTLDVSNLLVVIVLATNLSSVSVRVLLSFLIFLSTSAFLILRVVFSILSIFPLEVKFASAILSEIPAIWLFVLLVVRTRVFVPVSNVGFDGTVGSGMNSEEIRVPAESEISLRSETTATALLFAPTSCIPFATEPKNLESAWFSKLAVSTFKTEEVDEYEFDNVLFVLYGFSLYISVGLLYGPYLWFCRARRKVIDLFAPDAGIIPVTVSPSSNVPLVILTSRSLGTMNEVTSVLSKNPKNLVAGFSLLATASTFLDLIRVMSTLETSLSPRFTVSNLSLTPNWIPCLDCSVVVVKVSFLNWVNESSQVVVVVLLHQSVVVLVSTILEPFWIWVRTGPSTLLTPTQLVSHAFQLTGDRPVLESTPNWVIVASKLPSTSSVLWVLLVSTQVSVDGLSSMLPIQLGVLNGLTFSTLVANLFSINTLSV